MDQDEQEKQDELNARRKVIAEAFCYGKHADVFLSVTDDFGIAKNVREACSDCCYDATKRMEREQKDTALQQKAQLALDDTSPRLNPNDIPRGVADTLVDPGEKES